MHDYFAYYRHLKARFLEFVTDPARAEDDAAIYPHRCAHCTICRGRGMHAKRKADDHLSGVAGMRRDQLRSSKTAGIVSLAALARVDETRVPNG